MSDETLGGFFPLYRKLMDSDIWHRDDFQLKLWIYLLLNARYKDTEIRGITVKRGQYLRSYAKMADDLKLIHGRGFKARNPEGVRYGCDAMAKAGMITVEGNLFGVLITIVNYDTYNPKEGGTPTLVSGPEGCDVTPSSHTRMKEGSKKELQKQKSTTDADASITRVFEAYCQNVQTGARLTDAGKRKIATRRKEFTDAELVLSTERFSKSEWWMTNNSKKGVQWFFKSEDRIIQFLGIEPDADRNTNNGFDDGRMTADENWTDLIKDDDDVPDLDF